VGSGTRADRPQLAKLMASLKEGDVVLVTKLDRLGRGTRELLDLIERIGKAGAAFRSLGDPLWDTSSSQGRLLSTLLAAIAEFERDLIRERTGDGRKRAMAKGVKFGRKPKLSDYQRQEAIKRRKAGETLASIAKSYAVDDQHDLAARPVTKSVEGLEREFARQVRRFIDLAIAEGHSLQEAKAMARDVVARAVRQSFKAVVPSRPC
jgi:Resolvase, N terminal domain